MISPLNGKTLLAVNFCSRDGDYPADAGRELEAQNQLISIIDKDCAVLFATNIKRQRPCNSCFRTANALHGTLQKSDNWPCACSCAVSTGKSTALYWNNEIFEETLDREEYDKHQFEEHTPVSRCAYRVLRWKGANEVTFIFVVYHGPNRMSQGIDKKTYMRYLLDGFKRLSTQLGSLPVVFGGDLNLTLTDVKECFEDAIASDYEYSGCQCIGIGCEVGDGGQDPGNNSFWMMWHANHPPPVGIVNPFRFDGRQPIRFQDEPCQLQYFPSRVEFGGEAVAYQSIYGRTTLHKAAQYGDAERVSRLLTEGSADVNAKDNDGDTPLHYAAGSGHHEIVRMVGAESNAQIDAQNPSGSTALHYAASNGHHDTVKVLVELNANVCAIDDFECTALHFAASNGHTRTVRILVSAADNVDAEDIDGRTALHLAAGSGKIEVVKALKDLDADVGVIDEGELTALHLAALEGHIEIVRYLVDDFNADVHVEDTMGRTPLDFARISGHDEVVRFLEQQYSKSRSSSDPEEQEVPVMEDVNASDVFGRTALHHAAREGDHVRIRRLATARADLQARLSNGETALHVAARYGHPGVITVLVNDLNLDVNDVDNGGETALHTAASCGHPRAVMALLYDCDANFSVKSNSGKTACDLAESFGYIDIVDILKDRLEASSISNVSDGSGPGLSATFEGLNVG